jgi:Family of unknown function (DUF5947)
MSSGDGRHMSDPLAVLQRIRTTRPRPVAPPEERCEVCSEPIGGEHSHLVDLKARNLMCACRGCYLLFTSSGSGGSHYRAVPQRYVAFSDLELSSAKWDSLQIPVGIAFFFVNSSIGRVAAFYPGPAGATESELPMDTWEDVFGTSATLQTLEPDVEALLVRARSARRDADSSRDEAEYFIVPIDACYELVGRLRQLWRGFDGGSDAHTAMDEFFDRVRARAR